MGSIHYWNLIEQDLPVPNYSFLSNIMFQLLSLIIITRLLESVCVLSKAASTVYRPNLVMLQLGMINFHYYIDRTFCIAFRIIDYY
jgi:hypothetical protein